MTGNGQSDELFMAQRSLDTAEAFREHLDGDEMVAEQIRQLCEATWDAGWYSCASGVQISNPFRGHKDAPPGR